MLKHLSSFAITAVLCSKLFRLSWRVRTFYAAMLTSVLSLLFLYVVILDRPLSWIISSLRLRANSSGMSFQNPFLFPSPSGESSAVLWWAALSLGQDTRWVVTQSRHQSDHHTQADADFKSQSIWMKSFERQKIIMKTLQELTNTSSFELIVSIFKKGSILSSFSLSSFFIENFSTH